MLLKVAIHFLRNRCRMFESAVSDGGGSASKIWFREKVICAVSDPHTELNLVVDIKSVSVSSKTVRDGA